MQHGEAARGFPPHVKKGNRNVELHTEVAAGTVHDQPDRVFVVADVHAGRCSHDPEVAASCLRPSPTVSEVTTR
jgi:uncharacterized protein (DUF1786 family)